ncbi:MAG: membrane protein insertion efficiency factor YidD [Campylobacteraceae bacterium]
MKKFFLWLLAFYQRFLTLFSFGSCRYYPTCSEYAKWQMEYNSFLKALFYTTLRILRCNQFFDGGIDYPIIKINRLKKPRYLFCCCNNYKRRVIFWFFPKNSKDFYVVKAFNKMGI